MKFLKLLFLLTLSASVLMFCEDDKTARVDQPPDYGVSSRSPATAFPDTVMAFGLGSSNSLDIAAEKARLSMIANIQNMSTGVGWTFDRNARRMTAKTATDSLPEFREQRMTWRRSDRHVVMLLASTAIVDSGNTNQPYFTYIDTINTIKSDKILLASLVRELLDRYPEADRLEGRYWLSNIETIHFDDSEKKHLRVTIWVRLESPQLP